MNIRLITRIVGIITLFLGLAMLLPIPFSLYYNDSDWNGLLISAILALVLGSLSFLIKLENKDLKPKEGAFVVTLAWLTFASIGSLPYVITGSIPNYTDAFFETMSGFTTTGATILDDISVLEHGVLLWRSLTHWIGGMGIIVMSIAILPFLGVGGMQLFKAEVPGPFADKLKPRIAETAKVLWGVYVLISAIEVALLMFGGMDLFNSLCHTFGTMATGGFSTENSSIAAFDSAYFDFVIVFFMILAGTNFALHYNFLRGNFKIYFKNPEFKYFLYIIGAACFIIILDLILFSGFSILESLQYGIFQVVSIVTTTGYITADFEQWSISSQIILLFLMFIGGSAGSTGGGMKVMRIALLFKFAYYQIIRLIHPNAVIPVRIGGKVVDQKIMMNIIR